MPVLGWREWVSLPELGISFIKAKIDTGARTSALHAFDLHQIDDNGEPCVEFRLHPLQRNEAAQVNVRLPLLEVRTVRDSGGHEEQRCVVRTEIGFGDQRHNVEVTLTNRDNMGFRMLVGRTAMRGRFLVDPGRSYLLGRPRKALLAAYANTLTEPAG